MTDKSEICDYCESCNSMKPRSDFGYEIQRWGFSICSKCAHKKRNKDLEAQDHIEEYDNGEDAN